MTGAELAKIICDEDPEKSAYTLSPARMKVSKGRDGVITMNLTMKFDSEGDSLGYATRGSWVVVQVVDRKATQGDRAAKGAGE